MTDDPGADLRDRFRNASLPPAPVRLRERLAAVAATPIASTTPWFGRARLIVALAAAFAIASIGLLAAGGTDDPGPSPSTLTAEATLEATPEATAGPFPFQLICEEAEAPALTCTEIVETVLDLLGSNAEAIARLEVTRPCDTPCLPATRPVNFVITFASADVMDGSLGPGGAWQLMSSDIDPPITCTEVELPAPTCLEIASAVVGAFPPNSPPVERIVVATTCTGEDVPECSRSDLVDVHFETPDRLTVRLFLRDGPDGVTANFNESDPELTMRFGPEFAPDPPDGVVTLPGDDHVDWPWIWGAALSDDRQTLTVEFLARTACGVDYVPWVGPGRSPFDEDLFVRIVRLDRQSPSPGPTPTASPVGGVTGCDGAVTGRFVYHLALPEPFTRYVIWDLNSGEILDLER
jgi:hypothetical protein